MLARRYLARKEKRWGFNTCVALFEHLSLAQATPHLNAHLKQTGRTIDFEAASARRLGDAIAVAWIAPWLVVWDPVGVLFRPGKELRRLTPGRFVYVEMNSVSDTYSLDVSQGEVELRYVSWDQGELETSRGQPLAEEAGLVPAETQLDEDRQLALLGTLVGGSLSSLFEASYQVWESAETE